MNYHDLSKKELESLHASLSERFERVKSERLSLDLTRGKPAADQLDLSNDLDGILKGFYLLRDGTDVRNYGGILGIPEAREFGAELLGSTSDEVMVGGNSSLTLMYLFLRMMSELWQSAEDQPRFLCPVPGYDRHFAIWTSSNASCARMHLSKASGAYHGTQTQLDVPTVTKSLTACPDCPSMQVMTS